MATILYGGVVIGPMLAVAAELGLADLVADSPKTVDELAEATGSDSSALYRALSMLASLGVFTEVEPNVFGANDMSDTLRTSAEGSLRDLAIMYGHPATVIAGSQFLPSMKSGRPAFEHLHGTDWYSYIAEHTELGLIFNRAMGGMARQMNESALRSYDFTDVRSVIDVGGGAGYLVEMLLKSYPEVEAAIFDQPAVLAAASERLRDSGVAERVQFMPGDFFAEIPPGADIYILSRVLHDWNDKDVVSILTNVRKAMGERSRLLIFDAVIPEQLNVPHYAKLLDVILLSRYPGTERKESHVAGLLAEAGLRHADTRVTDGPCSLVVAECA
ncbi:methyltransferase [Nocardia sp. NPDC050793]|uniref:methyltransferase n=1 Tax=Nocardia sp. NPDC050793 TaxID=3155159 RepID=UPI0033EB7D41